MNQKIKTFAINVKEIFPLIGSRKSNSIGRKLLVSILCISSFFVLIQTSLQMKWDYDSGISRIEQLFSQIELGYTASLTKSLWEMHTTQIKSSALGIKQMPNVAKVEVQETIKDKSNGSFKNVTLAEIGVRPKEKFVERDIPILHNGSTIGNLKVFISLQTLYTDLYEKFIFVIISQSIKTCLVSIFILATFNYLVARHLKSMAKFSVATNLTNLDSLLELDRTQDPQPDELSLMVEALNETKANLKKLFASNQMAIKLELELEKKSEKETLQKHHQEQIQAKNQILEVQNERLATTIDTLKVTQDRLVTTEKMAALGGMVKGVAHELNTPIGLSITGVSHIEFETDNLKTLLGANKMKKSDLDDFLTTSIEMSRTISANLTKAAGLIHSFKMVSADHHEELISNFDLRENLENLILNLKESLKTNNVLFNNQLPSLIKVRSFPGVLYQIYTSLINNSVLHAFEHTEGGTVTVSFKKIDKHNYSIIYADDGSGMDDETVKQIFDPFFTTKRANGGTGLGMNILYTLVTEKLKGDISIESKIGKGSVFTINLPINSDRKH